MQTSEKKIKDPVKALIAILLFILFSVIIFGVVMLPARQYRKQDFDTAIVGSSRAKWGINPEIIYEESGIRAINLASGPAAMKGRFDTLTGAFERYDLNTVIIEIAYDAFEAGDVSSWSVYDSAWAAPKMVTSSTAVKYLTEDARIAFYDYDKVIGVYMDDALTGWKAVLTGKYDHYLLKAGADTALAEDWHLDEETAAQTRDTGEMIYYDNLEDLEVFRQMVQMCNDRGVRTIIVAVPNTEAIIWKLWGLDYRSWLVSYALQGLDYEYYDYNLYKNRQKYFKDENSFRDENHLCKEGAEVFSVMLTREILLKQPQEINTQELFYNNYEEAEAHSRYAGSITE